MMILAIQNWGWRAAYGILGGLAIVIGVMTLLFVKEPVRGRLIPKIAEVKKVEEVKEVEKEKNDDDGPDESSYSELLKNPVIQRALVGCFLRNFGGSVTTFFLPVFFGKNFPEFKA